MASGAEPSRSVAPPLLAGLLGAALAGAMPASAAPACGGGILATATAVAIDDGGALAFADGGGVVPDGIRLLPPSPMPPRMTAPSAATGSARRSR
ncbi:hypothetical protein [Methylobrevis pamukkalensis]|uniref:hypothetical protein n=1 Tax=Methylobrevis pamukkalensis TaxID=1439726 RepID=UPI0014712CB5|nr:hypothetical protein [Methylobrevis pamukkalensis]